MTTTMQLIAKQTVGANNASSVTFSNIPQTYTDLKLVISARGTTSGTSESIRVLPNGSSSSLTYVQLQGTGSAAFSGTGTYWYLGEMPANSATSSTFGSADIYIPNYTGSNNKSANSDNVQENNTSTAYANLNALLWSNTAAITSLTIQPNSNNFVEYSTFYLYGISNSTTTQATTVPYASGGDVITTDGTYWYHAFKYSGTFTPLKNIEADLLIVAGGGGGARTGGGGGAGGFRSFTAQSLTSGTNYTCTVGAGGAGTNDDNTYAVSGSNSSILAQGFTTLISTGGGGAAAYNRGNGYTGGSGGGSGGNTSSSGSSGNAGGFSPVEGYGGGGNSGSYFGGGGGGGAGGAGSPTTGGGIGGVGGVGVYSSLTDAMGAATKTGQLSSGHYYYAGGGGGGGNNLPAGGLGGGGNGGQYLGTIATAGTAGTGGGGGGEATSNTGGPGGMPGGSGIIIFRYAV